MRFPIPEREPDFTSSELGGYHKFWIVKYQSENNIEILYESSEFVEKYKGSVSEMRVLDECAQYRHHPGDSWITWYSGEHARMNLFIKVIRFNTCKIDEILLGEDCEEV